MIAKLFLIFTIVPLVELFVLLPLAGQIGVLPTVAIVVLTAIVGAYLGKNQGLSAWNRILDALGQGELPSDAIVDALLVLIACTLLITPGVLTDVTGILLLIPFARAPIRSVVKKAIASKIERGSLAAIDVGYGANGNFGATIGNLGPGTIKKNWASSNDEDVIDITPVVKTNNAG